MMNHFTIKWGISDTIIPTIIMIGGSIRPKNYIGLQIGKYCQVHEGDTPCNRNQTRTKGDICMGSSVNIQGGFKFMSLRPKKNITRQSWDMIPMPYEVIDRVNILGKYQQELSVFTDHRGQIIVDGDVDLTGVDGDEDEN